MHTPAAIRIEDDGRTAILKQVGVQLRAEILSPDAARFEIMDCQPLPSSPHPERQARNEGVKKLAVHLAIAKDTRLAVRFSPGAERAAPSIDSPKLLPLSAW
jgi:hypothetical protein